MDLPGNWTLNEPAAPTALEAAEATLGLPLPEDLRSFYLDADGGEAWFEEHHDEPGFFLQVLSLSDTLGMVEVMSEFDGWSDLIPFGTDGSRETFCLSRQNGHIYLADATQGVEDAIDCGGSFAHMVRRIAAGWNPFDGN